MPCKSAANNTQNQQEILDSQLADNDDPLQYLSIIWQGRGLHRFEIYFNIPPIPEFHISSNQPPDEAPKKKLSYSFAPFQLH